jgi:hypothetical protein
MKKQINNLLLLLSMLFLVVSTYNAQTTCTPQIEFTTVNGKLEGCGPFSVSFKDPNTTFARTWDFGDGKPSSSSTTPFHTFEGGILGDTTYTVTLTKTCNGEAKTTVKVRVYSVKSSIKRILSNLKDTNGNCTGQIEVSTIGGKKPFTYTWTNTSNSTTIPNGMGLCAGKYSVTVQDSNGCENQLSATIVDSVSSNNCSSFKVFVSKTKPNEKSSTNSACNGFIQLLVQGGHGAVNYTWANLPNNKTNVADGLCGGNYNGYVKDSLGCTAQFNAFVKDTMMNNGGGDTTKCANFKAHIVDARPNVKDANGNCTGRVEIAVEGGTKPYMITWANQTNVTGNVLENVCGGNYYGYVKDSLGCTAQFNAFVKDTMMNNGGGDTTKCANFKAHVVDARPNVKDANGNCTGRIEIAVEGGTKPYMITWANQTNVTGNVLENVCGGNYYGYVKDSLGCTAQFNAFVKDTMMNNGGGDTTKCAGFNAFVMNVKPNVKDANGNCTGRVEIGVNGGHKPYMFTWNNMPNNNGNIAEGLCKGDAMGYVKDSLGCTAQFVAFVPDTTDNNNGGGNPNNGKPCQVEIKGMPIDSTGLNFRLSFQTRIDNNGTVKSYELKIDGKVVSNDTMYIAKMTPGKHIIEYAITTSIGCEDRHIDTLVFPHFDGPKADCSGLKVELVSIINNKQGSTNCIGSIEVKAVGGKAPYNFHWMNNNFNGPINKGLCPGKYEVQVTDSNRCAVFASYEVKNDTVIGTNPCKDFKVELVKFLNDKDGDSLCTGFVEVRAVNGVAPFNFMWNNNVKAPLNDKLCPGVYTVNVKDANNCYASFTQEIKQDSVIVNNPCDGFKVEVVKVQNDLAGDNICTGRIEVRTIAGLAPFTYTWNVATIQSNVAEKVCAGNYTLAVKDKNNCTATLAVTVKTDSVPTTPQVDCKGFVVNIANVKNTVKGATTCSGGAYATISGGKQPYNYYWSNGVKDMFINNVCAGEYGFKAIDANGCVSSASAMVKEDSLVNVNNCSSLVANVIVKNDQATATGGCNGALEVSVNGGKAPYVFNWSTGSKDKAVKGLCEGKYYVTVTDANKCEVRIDKYVGRDSIIFNPCASFFANVIVRNDVDGDNVCTGALMANVGGGKAPYKYKWNDGTTNPYIKDACKGSYVVTVSDSMNCSLTIEKYVGLDSAANPCKNFYAKMTGFENSGINATICNGSLTASVFGGKAPYDFNWNNGAKTPSVTGLCPGEYSVEIKDANKCAVKIDGTVFIDSTKNLCDGFYTKVVSVINDKAGDNTCTGAIKTETFGGKAPYTYQWTNGTTNKDIIDVCAGKYALYVKDANNCLFQLDRMVGSDSIVDPCKGFYAYISNIVDDKEGNANCQGKLEVSVKGGVAPFNYYWSNGDTTKVSENLCADGYNVTVKDAKGCALTLNAKVRQIPAEKRTLVAKVHTADATEAGKCDGAMKVEIINGNAPFKFYHSNGEVGEYRTGICPGVYTVYVKDAKDQVLELTYLISAPTNTIENKKPEFKDSIVKDTVKASVTKDCTIDYNAIDSVKIQEYKLYGKDSVLVTWAVYNAGNVVFITDVYVFGKGTGVYKLKLDLFCNEDKDLGNYFSASEDLLYKEEIAAGINENKMDFVNIYPNPFSDQFTVQLDKVQDYTITVMDMSGKVLENNTYQNTNSVKMNLGHLVSGQYILRIVSDNNAITRMISK